MHTPFIKQPNSFTCGPVALYNLLVWTGKRFKTSIKQKTIKKLRRSCKCSLPFGTTFNNMNTALRDIVNSENLETTNIKLYPNLSDIKKCLEKGVVILNYHWHDKNKKGEHYVLLTELTKTGAHVINEGAAYPVKRFYTFRQLQTMLTIYRFEDYGEFKDLEWIDRVYPKAWFLKKTG